MDLKRLVEMLAEANTRHRTGPVVLYLVYPDGTSELLTLPPISMPQTEATPTGERCPSPGAKRLRGLILEQLRQVDKPISQAGLARKCGRANSGHFRETLETMVGIGEVRRLPTGHYWLPDRNLPSGWQG